MQLTLDEIAELAEQIADELCARVENDDRVKGNYIWVLRDWGTKDPRNRFTLEPVVRGEEFVDEKAAQRRVSFLPPQIREGRANFYVTVFEVVGNLLFAEYYKERYLSDSERTRRINSPPYVYRFFYNALWQPIPLSEKTLWEGEGLWEGGLGRLWQHIVEKQTPFIMITAYQCDQSKKENEEQNAKLYSALRGAGLGIVPILGNDFCGSEMVVERSFIAYLPPESGKTDQDLKALGLELARRFGQWGIIWYGRRSPDEEPCVWALGATDGREEKLKSVIATQGFDELKNFWSELKGRKFRFPQPQAESKERELDLCVLALRRPRCNFEGMTYGSGVFPHLIIPEKLAYKYRQLYRLYHLEGEKLIAE